LKNSRRDFLCVTAGSGLLAATAASAAQAAAKTSLTAALVREGSILRIRINDRSYDPLAFRTFRAEERNIREFYQAGVRLMSVLHSGLDCTLDVPYSRFGEIWTGPNQYNFANLDRQMDLFLKHAPDAYFNIMLQLDTRDWYLRAHPEYSNTFRNLVEMAGHEGWRADTAKALQDILRYVERQYGDRVFAYSLFCGGSTEWYSNSQSRKADSAIRNHPLKEEAFRRFVNDPQASLPQLTELYGTAEGALRHPKRDAAALRYWRFHNEIIADAILYFARRTQEVIGHRKLVGLFYGYLNTLRGKRLLEEGHLAYERVWQSPDIDMIFQPARYGEPRSFSGASGYLSTVDSIGLHDKLTFHEIDHTTYIAPTKVENGRAIPGADSKLKNEFETRMVLRREFMLTRVKRTGMWWFDFFGGYYYAEPLMKEVANLVRVQGKIERIPMHSVAQIAVFGDTQSMYFTSSLSRLSDDLVMDPVDQLARLGAPYDLYNFSDLDNPKIPWNQYRFVVFLNALTIDPTKRAFLENRVKKDRRTLLWIYAPNCIRESNVTAEGISEVTGIRVVGHDGVNGMAAIRADDALLQGSPSGLRFGFSQKLFPLFEVADERATILGGYVSGGAPALAYRKLEQHTSIYSAVANLPAALYRSLARQAGVHIYYEGRDPVYVNDRLMGIHMQSDPSPVILLPKGMDTAAEELFDGGKLRSQSGKLSIPVERGMAKLFLLGNSIGDPA
jgi:hypothetical protein